MIEEEKLMARKRIVHYVERFTVKIKNNTNEGRQQVSEDNCEANFTSKNIRVLQPHSSDLRVLSPRTSVPQCT